VRESRILPVALAVIVVAALGGLLATWPARPDPVEPRADADGARDGPASEAAGPPTAATASDAETRARGRLIEGRVLGRGGVPVAGAVIEVVAGASAGTDAATLPTARSGPDGAFVLEGVPVDAPGLRARHPTHADGEVEVTPSTTRVTVPLVPALVAWFRVRPPDGRAPEGVRVTATSGRFTRTQALSALGATDPEPPEPGLLGPVKVPADTRADVLFDVDVPGFAPWSIDDAAPATGATRVYEVGLVRPKAAGRVRVRLRTETGEPARYAQDVHARLEALDGGPGPRVLPRDGDGDVVFDGVPPGRWRVVVLSRGRAPATAEVDVKADEETSAEAAFTPEARARIRVVAHGGKPVLLRLTRRERPVPHYVDGLGDIWAPSFWTGEDGVVVGGLAPGEHVVEVIAPDLAPVGARFDARAGETVEVEVRPAPR
jgi:hypothetical protein